MLKKKLVTIVAAAFCVALVTAQQSGVNKVTTGLIEDGAIDSLKFGTEDGSGVIFGQYDNADSKITLGWGNSLSDTLWLSVFDSWYFKNSDEATTAKAKNTEQADDGINVDTTITEREIDGANKTAIKNDLGVGLGINDTLGFQLVWGADYTIYKNPANITGTAAIGQANGNETLIKSEVNTPDAGTNTKKEWTKYTNNNLKNNFTVNFKGVGIEDVGDIAFFVKLNKVYFIWNSINRTGDYTESTTTNGKTTSETAITGKSTENTLIPGLNFDLGLNVIDNDVATVKFIYEDEFAMGFKPRTNESSKTVKTPGTTTETTATNSYKVEAGKYLMWGNKFEPKLDAEFNVAEPLKLKAQLSLPVTLSQTIDEVGKYESSSQTETFNRAGGYSYLSANKTTTTGRATNSDDETQNKDTFRTMFAPKLSAGFVYEVTPGKFNVNFGVAAQPNYTWTTTTKTNANINTVTTTETKDQIGNSVTSKSVNVVDNGVEETKVTAVSTGLMTQVNLGATWFFTDNISFDVYFLNSFGSGAYSNSNIFGTSQAGASVTVKF